MSVSVHNGIAQVDTSVYSWSLLGNTCPTTLRRDVEVKSPFKILPNKKSTDNLVLVSKRFDENAELILFHIKKTCDDKVFVYADPEDVKSLVGADVNYQLHDSWIEVFVGKIRYTSDTEAIALEGESVMIADVDDILKFITGHIKAAELKKASVRAQRALTAKQQMKALERNLRNAGKIIAGLKTDVSIKQAELNKKQEQLDDIASSAR